MALHSVNEFEACELFLFTRRSTFFTSYGTCHLSSVVHWLRNNHRIV